MMENLMMILVSLKRNKGKSIFIVFQLMFCCFLILIFLGETEINLSLYNKVSKTIVSDVFQVTCGSINDNSKYSSHFASNVQLPQQESHGSSDGDMMKVYELLSKDSRIKFIGRTLDGAIAMGGKEENMIKIKGSEIRLLSLDEQAATIFKYKINKGMNFDEYKLSNDKTIPILVGPNVEKINPLGSIVNIPNCINKTSGQPYKFKIIGVLDPNQTLNLYSADLVKDGWFVIAPKLVSSCRIDGEGHQVDFKEIYIKLKDNKDIDKIEEELNLKIPDSCVYVRNIDKNLKDYTDMQKKQMVGIRDEIAIITLASLGIIGVSLYTLQKRKKEIGIRYSLGCSKKNIILMLLGENLILYAISIPLGLLAAYLVTMILKNQILIDGLVIGVTLGIMGVFMIISILPLVVKLIRLKPIELLRPKE